MKKNLIHFFAVVGFGTFILLACSVDDIADSINNNTEIASNNNGKYQLVKYGGGSYMWCLNTATGEVVRVSHNLENHTFTH